MSLARLALEQSTIAAQRTPHIMYRDFIVILTYAIRQNVAVGMLNGKTVPIAHSNPSFEI
jgi:hypothetical protein